jgi:hypothetical protein
VHFEIKAGGGGATSRRALGGRRDGGGDHRRQVARERESFDFGEEEEEQVSAELLFTVGCQPRWCTDVSQGRQRGWRPFVHRGIARCHVRTQGRQRGWHPNAHLRRQLPWHP